MRTDFIKVIGIYTTANNKVYITLPYHSPPNSVSMLFILQSSNFYS